MTDVALASNSLRCRTLTTFFADTPPASRNANPACMTVVGRAVRKQARKRTVIAHTEHNAREEHAEGLVEQAVAVRTDVWLAGVCDDVGHAVANRPRNSPPQHFHSRSHSRAISSDSMVEEEECLLASEPSSCCTYAASPCRCRSSPARSTCAGTRSRPLCCNHQQMSGQYTANLT